MRDGYTAQGLTFFVSFLIIIVASLFLAFNPLEMIKERRDQTFKQDAESITKALDEYYSTHRAYPWTANASTSSEISWTPVASEKIGICDNEMCTAGGVLFQAQRMDQSVLPRVAATLKRESEGIFVGRGSSTKDKIYACFIPSSSRVRNNFGELFKITPGAPVNFGGKPESCTDSVTWEGEHVCYLCVSN